MRVTVIPTAFDAMGFYRLIWPAQACIMAGHHVEILYPDTPDRLPYAADWNGKVVDVWTPDTEVIVLQRVTQPVLLDIIRIWQTRGKRVVVDIDDDLRAVTPHTNPGAFKLMHQQHGLDGNRGTPADYIGWQTTEDACKEADVVTTSSRALFDRYPHPKGRYLLRNCVPGWYLSHEPTPVDGLVGWAGAVAFRYTDPDELGGSLGRLQREGFNFGVVGPPDKVVEAFKLDRPPLLTGAVPLDQYPKELAKFQVGISPLADTAFNRAKSWLKMIEYASLGVPCVVSDMPEYRVLHRMGVGVLANNPRQWYVRLRSLLTQPSYRADVSVWGRSAVSGWTFERRASDWWEAWTGELTTHIPHVD